MSATATATAPATVPAHAGPISVDDATAARFHRDGVTVVRGLLTPEEVAFYRAASLRVTARPEEGEPSAYKRAFRQVVNVWREDPVLARLTLHPRLTQAVNQIMRRPMRLWHDHILTKAPRNGQASEFHQDQPYWPFPRSVDAISGWIALGDTPVEHGCMDFIPGSHRLRDLAAQDLTDAGSLFALRPELAMAERTTIPLRAGDVTFHTGFTAHHAGPNQLDVPRVAHVVIFVEAGVRLDGRGHCVTSPLGLQAGDALPDDLCPGI